MTYTIFNSCYPHTKRKAPGILLRLFVTVIFNVLLALPVDSFAQIVPINPGTSKQTFTYAVKGADSLGLDVYNSTPADTAKPCVIFIFGGAFMAGHRDDSIYNQYFNSLVSHNYIVISVSYRLGLQHAKHLSKFNIAPLREAVNMAVEDVCDATAWVVKHAEKLGIDTGKIVLSGSSSGAITTLVTDYSRSRHLPVAASLPAGFRYAGIISFSGAVLSFDGKLKYNERPAPALLFHGTADRIVPYNKIRFLNKGFYGSSWIAKTYKKQNHPYFIYRAVGLGHEVAIKPMYDQWDIIAGFLDRFVSKSEALQVDMNFDDPSQKPMMTLTPQQLFRKLQNAQ